mgnify:CR=1 FL=1
MKEREMMTDIHDILPPVAVGIHADWLLPLLLALTAAALLSGALWFWKKHRKRRQIETIVPELPPEMVAMRAIDEIADVRRFDPKTFYYRLSAILRRYISGRFNVGAPEMTTEEFVPCIDRLSLASTLARRLKHLSQAMDPVKFGAEMVSEQQMESDLYFTREFVTQTTAMPAENNPDGHSAASEKDHSDSDSKRMTAA